MKKLLVFLSVLAFVSLTMIKISFSQNLEFLAEIASARNIQAINARDITPNEIVFATLNVGAGCGGGTPASAWKIILDPDTGDVISVTKKQDLSKIQNIRDSLFESSDGTLFTGGGWCGYKPPYYSTDGGETWQSADADPVHPPNSTFSFAEFNSDIYAGTGYAPYHGEVYRWLGNGNWKKVLDTGSARNIVNSMAVYNGQLFVAANLYGATCTGVPVYVSSDGNFFIVTTGIDPCYNAQQLLVANEELAAWVSNLNNAEDYVYRWTGSLWEKLGDFGLEGGYTYRKAAVSNDGKIYFYGHLSEDPSPGIYQSTDLGLTWQQIAEFEGPSVNTLHLHDNVLYIGTNSDSNNKAYIYRLVLNQPPVAICQSVTVSADENCQAYASIDDGSYDPDGDTITLSQAPSGPYPLGTTTVTLTVSDGSLTDSCEATVTVVDATAPVIICPDDVTIECDESTAPSNTGESTATDNCDADPEITYSDLTTPGTCPREYTITRAWSATDDSVNSDSCVQTISVVDTTAPIVSCNSPATITPPDAPISFTATAMDNCDEDVSVEITEYDCWWINPADKLKSKLDSCVVEVAGDTITILDTGGVNDNITWTVVATDDCGNTATLECGVLVVNPAL